MDIQATSFTGLNILNIFVAPNYKKSFIRTSLHSCQYNPCSLFTNRHFPQLYWSANIFTNAFCVRGFYNCAFKTIYCYRRKVDGFPTVKTEVYIYLGIA
jgi:hypothetical protein